MKTPILDRLATFQRRSVTQEATFGTDVVTWVPVAYLPGSPPVAEKFRVELQDVLPSRSERVDSGLKLASNPTRLRMRWRNDIDSTMRVTVHGDADVVYQIISGPAEIMGRKRYLEMMLEHVSTTGTEP